MTDAWEITKSAIDKFLGQDYAACIDTLQRISETTAFHLQLMLISLQRLDRVDDVEAFAARVLSRPDDYPWEHALFQLSLGLAGPDAALAAASTDAERAEALWYAAERRITLGDLAGAEAAYRAAAGIDVTCNERILAAEQLERLLDPASGFPAAGAQARALARWLAGLRTARDTPLYRSVLSAYGDALLHLGANAEAVKAFEELVPLVREAAGERSPDHAEAVWQLAVAHRVLGNLEYAEQLLRTSLEIRPAPHALATLAGVRAERGDPASAARLLESIAIRDRLMTYNLAELKFRLGDPDTAERLLGEMRAEGPAGDRLDTLADALLSAIRLRRGEPAAAFELASSAFAAAPATVGQPLERDQIAVRLLTAALLTDWLDAAAGALSALLDTQQAMLYDAPTVGTARGRTRIASYAQQLAELTLSVVSDRITTFPGAGALLCEVLLSSKNIAARLAAGRFAAYGPLAAVEEEIYRLEMAGPGRDFEHYRNRLDELRDRRDVLELRMAGTREGLPDVARIAAAVPPGHVLVEYARFRRTEARPEGLARVSGQQQYLAVVLHAGGASPVAVPLGPAEPIDAAVKQYRDVVEGNDEGPARLLDTIGGRIRELIFDPLRPHLGRADRLVIAPDGEIGGMPLEVLGVDGGGHLIDHFRFRYIGCAADLVIPSAPPDPAPAPSVVVAAPDYDLSTGEPARPVDDTMAEVRELTQRFPALDGAREEGERVAELLGVPVLTGPRATKDRLRDADRPQVLHLATHGFYLPSLGYDLFELTGSTVHIAADDMAAGRLAGDRLLSPLLRSGLALAGANEWLAFREPPPEAGNGLLTADDVLRMRLRGTDLVVLSACEAGLGQAKNLEGMTGLRQAFLTAGARALISSVWVVPDRQTPKFFGAFYRHLRGGATTQEALREAQLEIRGRRPHPRFWGGFVHYGDASVRLTRQVIDEPDDAAGPT